VDVVALPGLQVIIVTVVLAVDNLAAEGELLVVTIEMSSLGGNNEASFNTVSTLSVGAVVIVIGDGVLEFFNDGVVIVVLVSIGFVIIVLVTIRLVVIVVLATIGFVIVVLASV
jgi:hypothetical protein